MQACFCRLLLKRCCSFEDGHLKCVICCLLAAQTWLYSVAHFDPFHRHPLCIPFFYTEFWNLDICHFRFPACVGGVSRQQTHTLLRHTARLLPDHVRICCIARCIVLLRSICVPNFTWRYGFEIWRCSRQHLAMLSPLRSGLANGVNIPYFTFS